MIKVYVSSSKWLWCNVDFIYIMNLWGMLSINFGIVYILYQSFFVTYVVCQSLYVICQIMHPLALQQPFFHFTINSKFKALGLLNAPLFSRGGWGSLTKWWMSSTLNVTTIFVTFLFILMVKLLKTVDTYNNNDRKQINLPPCPKSFGLRVK